jgi:hypothetical protein
VPFLVRDIKHLDPVDRVSRLVDAFWGLGGFLGRGWRSHGWKIVSGGVGVAQPTTW